MRPHGLVCLAAIPRSDSRDYWITAFSWIWPASSKSRREMKAPRASSLFVQTLIIMSRSCLEILFQPRSCSSCELLNHLSLDHCYRCISIEFHISIMSTHLVLSFVGHLNYFKFSFRVRTTYLECI